MNFIEPTSAPGRKARDDFFKRIHADLPKGNPFDRGVYCHAAVMRYIRNNINDPECANAKVVVLGTPGYYRPAHSLIVNAEETKILRDTFSGVFVNGKYEFRMSVDSPKLAYSVYYCSKASDLWAWASEPLVGLPKATAFRGLNIKDR